MFPAFEPQYVFGADTFCASYGKLSQNTRNRKETSLSLGADREVISAYGVIFALDNGRPYTS
jgi:hypothetical protein